MQDIHNIIDSAISEAIEQIKQASTSAGQKVTGRTLASLEGRVTVEANGNFVAEILGRPFFGALETGSGPARSKGSESARKQFITDLTLWCKARGFTSSGLSDEQYERVAKWLAWYLKRYGSSLYRKGGRRDIFTPAVDVLTQRLLEDIPLLFSQQIVNEFTRGFQGFGNAAK